MKDTIESYRRTKTMLKELSKNLKHPKNVEDNIIKT